ncbi:transposase [Streptomyces cinnamoneus]|uniref:transposase n=1 Tax=Streptomyces cinnamoneus TaxID=53446 RepID=UPI003421D310
MGAATRGFDAGKKINGRKRHLAVDMRGMPLTFMVAPATNRDDQPARDLLFRLRLAHPEVTVAWADSAYGGELVRWSKSFLGITLHTVPRRRTRTDSPSSRNGGASNARSPGSCEPAEMSGITSGSSPTARPTSPGP